MTGKMPCNTFMVEYPYREEIAALEAAVKEKERQIALLLKTQEQDDKEAEYLHGEIAKKDEDLNTARQNYDTALDEWQHCVEEIATLKEKVNQLVIADS